MMIVVRTCCYACDLRTGVLLIGIFGLFYSSFVLYSNYHEYKDFKNQEGSALEDESPDKYLKVAIRLRLVGVTFGGMSMLANVLLLWSYCSRNPYLAYPYLYLNISMLFYAFGFTIFSLTFTALFSYVYLVTASWFILTIYLMNVVYSYVQTLRQDPSAFDTGIAMQGPPYSRFPEVPTE